jgi:endonuclease/exonuclease/phosphatase family metal-dependent hydrolase
MLHGRPDFETLPQRLALIADEIRRLDADIICLQEVPWTPEVGNGAEWLARQTGMNYAYLRANGNRRLIRFEEGEAILSRFPLRETHFTELKPRADFFEHRVALGARVGTPWGDMNIFVTHLTNGEPEDNHGQANSLRAFVDASGEGPAIIAGDFNARENTPQIAMLSDGWLDAYRMANPGDSGLTCCISDLFTPGASVEEGALEAMEKRIDYLFLRLDQGQAFSLLEVQRVFDRPFAKEGGWLWASDHVGLLMTLAPGG